MVGVGGRVIRGKSEANAGGVGLEQVSDVERGLGKESFRRVLKSTRCLLGSQCGCWRTDEANVFMSVHEKMGGRVLDELKFIEESGQ